MGRKAVDLLNLIPEIEIEVVERCSGHGGLWGMKKDNHATAVKVGRPAARRALENGTRYVVSECPLAGAHLHQGMERIGKPAATHVPHPVRLLARAYRS